MQPPVQQQRTRSKKTFKPHGEMNAPPAQMESWGRREGDLNYSLEVVQHPLRARMCGFGDKARPKTLGPAAVAKMLVTRQDDTVVDAEIRNGRNESCTPPIFGWACNKFISKSTNETTPTTAYSAPPPSHYDTQSSTPAPAPTGYPPRHEGPYPPRGPEENAGYPQRPDAAYGGPRPEGAGYTGRPDDSHTQTQYANAYEDPRGTGHLTIHHQRRPYPPPAPAPGQWNYGSQNPAYIDPALQQPPHMQPPHGQPPPVPAPGPAYSEEGVYPSNAPGASYYVQTPAALHGAATTQHDGSSATNGQYTRTLVGPLSANASRLVDAENQPGIFFLFQDLSVRTEGTFRLRMRLMNVGAHPAPNAHATHVTTTSAPVLAQTFTDPFTVYSAKRFPGVPETTPLSVAFGTQGQKLPLRNRNPGTSSKKGGRKNRGNGSDSEGDSEGGDSDDSRGTG
ncbi:Developmental and secondary metabolism regulator veA [Rhizoctonia solani]|uniref:Developmental and secondary metabolism regulator veA n=1 Tax=Rhizoctonia solani TaxID=456999 RepID=A0A8H7IJ98_9AGAM|nr:Developmental and secondary metabolism regulator veA [Rhizoctonia solani]